MEKPGVLNFEVGQHAEMKTFEEGYRSAWFRCKIMDINLEENTVLPEYYDFPDEVIAWTEIYKVRPYGRMLKQLMLRPQFPTIYHKSQMPPLTEISEVCVIIDGTWKAGNLVDWKKDDCYWSATVTKVLSSDKVEIVLPKPPAGEGKGPMLRHEAFCKDLRPSLDWTARKGWTLPVVKKGQTTCSAKLVYPSKQAGSPVNASATSHTSVNSLAVVTTEEKEAMNANNSEDSLEKASSTDSISTRHVQECKTDAGSIWEDIDYDIDLNIMHEDTLEAAITDLEELANRIKWIKSILEGIPPTSSLEFVEQIPPSP